MQSIESPALVVNMSGFGESHRFLLLAAPEATTIRAIARHARKSLKRFPGALDYFTLIHVELSRKSARDELWHLERAAVVRRYAGIVSGLHRYLAGCWLIETYRIHVPRELDDPLFFSWLRDGFEHLDAREPGPAFVFASFIRLLRITGNMPSFERCVACGREAPEKAGAYFDPRAGGIVCRRCGGKKNLLPASLRRFIVRAARIESLAELEEMPEELEEEASRGSRLLLDIVTALGAELSSRRNYSEELLRSELESRPAMK